MRNMLARVFFAVSGVDHRSLSLRLRPCARPSRCRCAATGSCSVSARLVRTVADRRVLYPFAALMAVPLLNALAVSHNVAEGMSAAVGFDGGRLFFVWFVAVPALAVYAVADLAVGTQISNVAKKDVYAASVSLPLVALGAALTMSVGSTQPFLLPERLGWSGTCRQLPWTPPLIRSHGSLRLGG